MNIQKPNKRGKFITFFLLIQTLSLLSTLSLLVLKIFFDISWFYVFLPVIITVITPSVLFLSIMCFLLLVILLFGKSKGIKDIHTIVKNKKGG